MSSSAPTGRWATFGRQSSITTRCGTSRSCSGVRSDPLARREGAGGAGGPTSRDPDPGWSDERLVQACLAGDQRAWSALVDKYKHLIYAIAVRRGASAEDAADIFQ